MPELTDKSELDAYYISDPAHPRVAAIMWPLILEKRIDSLFSLALRPDHKIRKELFRPSGALGNFAAKVQLAYLLGWIGKDIFDDLITVSKIRNRFAHHLDVKDFSDQNISSWLANLRGSKFLPGMLKSAKKKVAAVGDKPPPKISEQSSVSPKTYLFILEGIAEDPQLQLRWCIDLMIHQLDKSAENMKKNLEGLPGSWLVGEEKPEKFRTE